MEDDVSLAVSTRTDMLASLERVLRGDDQLLGIVASNGRTDAERELMNGADRVIAAFRALPATDQAAIVPWVAEMIAGMKTTVSRATDSNAAWFEDVDELRRYCYYVAGTVGHLLTDLFRIHCRGIDADRYAKLAALATNFGLALQLTNVIRDIADDRLAGRNLVPRRLLADAGLLPGELFRPGREAESRRVVFALVDEARSCLTDALAYSCALPRSAARVRLFCFSHLFFACRTLVLVRRRFGEMAGGRRLKMSRAGVYGITLTTLLLAPFNGALGGLFRLLSRPLRPEPA